MISVAKKTFQFLHFHKSKCGVKDRYKLSQLVHEAGLVVER